jgi:hypothetical protein
MSNDALHALLVWATLLGAAGCSSTSQATSTSVLRPDIGEVPEELKRDYEVFAHNCSKCHDIDRALTAPVTDNHHWELYVAKMMRTPGSGIQKLEAPHILRFLFWYTDRKAGRVEMGQMKASESAPPAELAPLPAVTPAPADPIQIQGESTP